MLDNQLVDKSFITKGLKKTQDLMTQMQSDEALHHQIQLAIDMVCACLNKGNKLLFAGNGGSAADAQHMSAEYVSRFMFDRPGLPAFALTTDTSAITAIGNDYGFENLFSRQVQAVAQPDDVLFAYSTSGTSPNIIKGLEEAKNQGVKTIGMMGIKPTSQVMIDRCDIAIQIPSLETAHIQEGHLVVGHLICCAVEQMIFKSEKPA